MQTLFSGFILPAPVSLDLFVLQTWYYSLHFF
jgi:hypothetical protein